MAAELRENEYVGCRYIIKYKSGKGKAGGQVYSVEDSRDLEAPRRVLKYPARKEEHEALQRLHQISHAPLLGLSRFFDCGLHRDSSFVVMEYLGRPMLEVVRSLKVSLDARWACLRVLGRMLLRRLEGIHRAGVVHCDLQPGNILLDRSGSYEAAVHWRPYLIDFGCAQCLPWSKWLRPDFGTVDFNSIHSADGGPRGPCDDVESLGWVLCYGLLGELPWFWHTKKAKWTGGKLEEQQRPIVCAKVKQDKSALLDVGEAAFGVEWSHLAYVPPELRDFLCIARAGSFQEGGGCLPDYRMLDVALGGRGLDPAEGEREDLEEYSYEHLRCEAAGCYLDNLLR